MLMWSTRAVRRQSYIATPLGPNRERCFAEYRKVGDTSMGTFTN
jgi:hypothetical protein